MRKRIRGILMSGKQFSLDSHLDLVQGIANHTAHRPTSEPSSTLPLVEDKNEIEENNGTDNDSGTVNIYHLILLENARNMYSFS